MREYKEYMNRISGGAELKRKIMQSIIEQAREITIDDKPRPYGDPSLYVPLVAENTTDVHVKELRKKRSGMIMGLIGLGACAALLVFGFMYLPGLLNRPAVIIPDDGIDEIVESGVEVEGVSPLPSYNDTQGEYEIIFNFHEIIGYERQDVHFDNKFSMGLTEEEFAAVFPEMGINILGAFGLFRGDGSVVEIIINESPDWWMDVGDPLFSRTSVRISDRPMERFIVFRVDDSTPEPLFSHVAGVEVMAIVYERIEMTPQRDYSLPFPTVGIRIDFEIDGVFYLIDIVDDLDSGMDFATSLVNRIISGGPADLSVFDEVIIPVRRYPEITMEEAMADDVFGQILSSIFPEDFAMVWGRRTYTAHENSISLHLRRDDGYVTDFMNLTIRELPMFTRIPTVSIDDRHVYDWSLHPIQFTDEWDELMHNNPIAWMIRNPIFLAEDLTLDVISARNSWFWIDYRTDIIDRPFRYIEFSVLYGDMLIHIYSQNVSPETLWEMLRGY